jgi:hypothetical protein
MWIGQFQPKSQRSLKSSAVTLLEIALSSFLAAAGQGAFGLRFRLRAEPRFGMTSPAMSWPCSCRVPSGGEMDTAMRRSPSNLLVIVVTVASLLSAVLFIAVSSRRPSSGRSWLTSLAHGQLVSWRLHVWPSQRRTREARLAARYRLQPLRIAPSWLADAVLPKRIKFGALDRWEEARRPLECEDGLRHRRGATMSRSL